MSWKANILSVTPTATSTQNSADQTNTAAPPVTPVLAVLARLDENRALASSAIAKALMLRSPT